jgi:hypothetical protein
MKTVILTILASVMLAVPAGAFAQQREKFDIVTFKTPRGWQKQAGENAVQLGGERDGASCLVTMFKAVPGSPDAKFNFDSAWETIVEEMVKVAGKPQMQPSASENGWTSQSGLAGYEVDGKKGVVLLVTLTGGGKMVNIMILTDSNAFEAEIASFLGSIDLPKVAETAQTAQPSADSPIVGTWAKASGSSIAYANPVSAGTAGYAKDQYEFRADGTYSFYSKLFRYSMDKLLFVRESGTYRISGNSLTITPQKSVIETWSKRNGTDKWGALVSSQRRPIESVTYQFTKHYFSGIQQWNLVLQAASPTNRDGSFSGNTTFPNAYYYAPISPNNTAIEVP